MLTPHLAPNMEQEMKKPKDGEFTQVKEIFIGDLGSTKLMHSIVMKLNIVQVVVLTIDLFVAF